MASNVDSTPQWFMQRRIKLQHIKVLASFPQHETLHQVAKHLGISQPAASKIIAELETAVRHELFTRSGRLLIPNDLGRILIRHSVAMLRELGHASDELAAMVDGRRGHVAIGAIDGPTVNELADFLVYLKEHFPLIEARVETASSAQLIKLLEQRKLDIVLGRATPTLDRSRFSYREIGAERLAVVGRYDHPLSQEKCLRIKDLQQENWIIQSKNSTLRAWFDALFVERDLSAPAHIVNTDSLLMTLAYLSRTDALSVLSEPVALQQAACKQLSILSIDVNTTTTPYGLIVPVDTSSSPILTTVLNVLTPLVRKHYSHKTR
ncbi:LysR substrate-binding domain-containing protein [Kozakia baliensis]|uniref:LysR substrate-binding domain-containing protein n=1 Tax=Kozakia baliensis TaxID=153496 RepID=UPI00049598ED|nr:LysR substrate-binding domain-containing protein [Kozakia baliensis]